MEGGGLFCSEFFLTFRQKPFSIPLHLHTNPRPKHITEKRRFLEIDLYSRTAYNHIYCVYRQKKIEWPIAYNHIYCVYRQKKIE